MLVTARDHDAMLLHLEEAMAELRLHGLKLNMKKCKFRFQQINWLGFKISGKGVQPDSSKVEHVRRMTPPTNVSEIKSQLAFFQFNSPMVEKIQWTMQPLQALTSPHSNWRSVVRSGPLPEKAMQAWLELKRILLSEPCIAWPDTCLHFQMFADAKAENATDRGGIAAILTQHQGSVTRPISYFSRQLRDSEQRYSAFAAELLAVANGLQHWESLLKGASITVFTDHLPVVHNSTRATTTMNHLIEKILSVDAQLVHIMGPDNQIADYVSRNLTSGDKAQVEQYLKRKVIPEDMIVAHMARAAHKQNQVGSASVFAAKVPPILSPASIKHWQQEQGTDTLCQHVKAFVIHKRVPSNHYYARIVRLYGHKSILGEDTLLYLIDGRDKQVFAKRVWVPQTMRILILADSHGSSLGGHWVQKSWYKVFSPVIFGQLPPMQKHSSATAQIVTSMLTIRPLEPGFH